MFEWFNRFLLGRFLSGVGSRQAPPATSSRAAGPVGRMLRARYEAAETTQENAPLWGLTDYLSAKAANNFQVRRQLKIRSRYERANNSYYSGIVDTIASDLIGTGPRLQVRTGNAGADAMIQARWHAWAASINLAEKLRTMTKAKIVDGEAFCLFVTNRELARTWQKLPLVPGVPTAEVRVDDVVQLDMVVIESDQVMTPSAQFVSMFWVDGMLLDPLGNVIEYHVLRQHPGDLFIANNLSPLDYDRWPNRFVAHWFKRDRPGQCRGVPEVTPALDQFGFLRRFEKAVMQASESAADIAVLLTTKAPADADPASQNNTDIGAGLYPGETMPIDRSQMTALPDGYDAKQIHAEQPSTQYEMFERLTMRQINRSLGVPLGLALGDHSAYNYSSGRLDHLGYHRKQRIDRHDCQTCVLEKAYRHWAEEGANIPGYFPPGVNVAQVWHHWHWQANERIDLVKEATADGLDLQNNTSTLAEKYAEQGKDWEAEIRQRAVEIKLCQQLGITPADAAPSKAAPAPRPAKRGMSGAGGRKRQKLLATIRDELA